MRSKFLITLAVALAASSSLSVRAQEQQPASPQDEEVRGAFVTTRPSAGKDVKKAEAAHATTPAPNKPAAKTAGGAPNRHRTSGARVGGAQVAGGTAGGASGAAGDVQFGKTKFDPAGIGLGYTLFMRDDAGAAVRVSPRREFHTGEAIRLLVESNTDGYLYIFDAENDATPQLIFPNAKLNRGDNRIGAHVPYEIPSGKEEDESLRWFVFNDTPATERVYVVVSRTPLEGVPVGESLVKLCAESDQSCVWKPTPQQWAGLRTANAGDRVAVSQAKDDGRAQTATEKEAAVRGLGLSTDAPLPSVIYMIASTNTNVLVTTVDLIHK
ncbi:MAG: DUF4384 domain-containing protein [Acidobacteria bacterium]|nr:DUF4384 domain-containing protein [Acidobacteriota bacterium]